MLAAEWSSVAMRKLAAVCERAIGRTEQQGGEQPLKRFCYSYALNVPKVAGTWVAPEHLLQNYQCGFRPCRFFLNALSRAHRRRVLVIVRSFVRAARGAITHDPSSFHPPPSALHCQMPSAIPHVTREFTRQFTTSSSIDDLLTQAGGFSSYQRAKHSCAPAASRAPRPRVYYPIFYCRGSTQYGPN